MDMPANISSLFPSLADTVAKAGAQQVPPERRMVLAPLVAYVQDKTDRGEAANLSFICTHNSRRSQLSQVWAQTAAYVHGIPAHCFSGGVEVTAFDGRAVASLRRSGFRITSSEGVNPEHLVFYAAEAPPVRTFSKLFDDPANLADRFAAVMTCAHAEENCPFIPGAEQRIPVRYEDPKAFDDTPVEAARYDERSMQIASEMLYVFSCVLPK
ncbi:MAG: hypothetical protein RLY31_38 [Bacteroidota bacterium]|jgi:arsenate reductase